MSPMSVQAPAGTSLNVTKTITDEIERRIRADGKLKGDVKYLQTVVGRNCVGRGRERAIRAHSTRRFKCPCMGPKAAPFDKIGRFFGTSLPAACRGARCEMKPDADAANRNPKTGQNHSRQWQQPDYSSVGSQRLRRRRCAASNQHGRYRLYPASSRGSESVRRDCQHGTPGTYGTRPVIQGQPAGSAGASGPGACGGIWPERHRCRHDRLNRAARRHYGQVPRSERLQPVRHQRHSGRRRSAAAFTRSETIPVGYQNGNPIPLR